MKVMCINDNYPQPDGFEPKFGEIVTVVGECNVHPNHYDLLEYPVAACGKPQSFDKNHFAPLSDIDETELAEQCKSQSPVL